MTGSDPWDFSEYEKKPAPTADPSSPWSSGDLGPSRTSPPPPNPVSGGFDFAGAAGTAGIAAAGPATIGRAPAHWLAAGAAAALVGGLLAGLLGDSPQVALVAWLLSGPIAIVLLALFVTHDTRARAQPAYDLRAWVKPAYVACLVLCGLAVVASALRIAIWVGRL